MSHPTQNPRQPLVIEYGPDEDHWDVYHRTMEAQDALPEQLVDDEPHENPRARWAHD